MNPGTTPGDVLALVWGMRGLVQAAGEVTPGKSLPPPGHDSSTFTWPACGPRDQGERVTFWLWNVFRIRLDMAYISGRDVTGALHIAHAV